MITIESLKSAFKALKLTARFQSISHFQSAWIFSHIMTESGADSQRGAMNQTSSFHLPLLWCNKYFGHG